MANLWDIIGKGIQKPQSMLAGAELGGLRWLGLADPNSQYEKGASNPISGLWEGTKHSIRPHDIVNEMAGDSTPGLLQKIVGTGADIFDDPTIALGGLAKAGELGSTAAKIADVMGGAKIGKYVEDAGLGSKIGAGALRALGRTYQGTLADENNNPIQGFALGQIGAGAGKGLGKLGEYAGKAAPEGSKLATYLQGRAAGKALSSAAGTGTAEEEAAFLRDPVLKGADRAKGLAASKLAGASTPEEAAAAALEPFSVPSTVKTGPGKFEEMPGMMTIDPGAKGGQATVPWQQRLVPDPNEEALFGRSAMEDAKLFDPSKLEPGQLAQATGTPMGRAEAQSLFPSALEKPPSVPTPFNEPQFGPQQDLPLQQAAQRRILPQAATTQGSGPVGNPVGPEIQGQMSLGNGPQQNETDLLESLFNAPSAPPQGQLFDPSGMPPGQMARDPRLGVPAPRDWQPPPTQNPLQGQLPPWLRSQQTPSLQEGMGPSIQGELPFGQGQQAPMGRPAPSPVMQPNQAASGYQSVLPDVASGGDIVKAIQEALQNGVPYNEVMRVILQHQFPGRI